MEYREIQQQFNKVLMHSQNLSSVKTDELFDNWYRAKSTFIKYFGGDLIYEVGHIDAVLDNSELMNYTQNFLNKVWHILDHNTEIFNPFERFISTNYKDFASNILHYDWKISEDKTIYAGTKFTKSFKHFISNEKALNEIQMLASEITQKSKISGTLCLSVHPLDYLSISENAHGWRSCHALDGEYRSGNLSYMQDSSTIVCYIKSEDGDNFSLPRFPDSIKWNSKKWRMLLFVSDDNKMIFAGRHYPFMCKTAMDEVRNVFLNLFTSKQAFWFGGYEKDSWTNWQNYYITDIQYPDGDYIEYYNNFVPVPGSIMNIRDLVEDVIGPESEEDEPLHYNDLLRSSCYTKPYYSFYKFFNGDKPHFTIGSAVKCVKCGKEYIYDEPMICEDCINAVEEEIESSSQEDIHLELNNIDTSISYNHVRIDNNIIEPFATRIGG